MPGKQPNYPLCRATPPTQRGSYWNDSQSGVKHDFSLTGELNILWVMGVDYGEKPASAFESELCEWALSLRFKWKPRP
jgi:hypothetical protein